MRFRSILQRCIHMKSFKMTDVTRNMPLAQVALILPQIGNTLRPEVRLAPAVGECERGSQIRPRVGGLIPIHWWT